MPLLRGSVARAELLGLSQSRLLEGSHRRPDTLQAARGSVSSTTSPRGKWHGVGLCSQIANPPLSGDPHAPMSPAGLADAPALAVGGESGKWGKKILLQL